MKQKRRKTRDKKNYIYGHHAVSEALQYAPESLKTIFISDSSTHRVQIKQQAEQAGIPIKQLGSDKKTRRTEHDVSHQGIVGEFIPKNLTIPYKDFINNLEVTPNTSLVILGELQDPHNVGAVIRNAAAFGAAGVLIPDHNQAPITGTVVKVSAGMAFRIPLVHIGNINTTLRDLKDKDFWIYGLDAHGTTEIHTETYDRASAFILGNESKGLRPKTHELCDSILSIPIDERCESLNAAVSAGIVLYSWYTQKK